MAEKKSKKQSKEIQKDDAKEIKELLQRTQANFENYRKQTDKRIEEIHQNAARNIIVELLPVLDNFELALQNAEANLEEFKKGVELIYAQFNTLLQDNHVTPITTDNKMFDPYYHEALMKVESDQPENRIIEEFQKGFMLHNTVIRAAKVKVSAGKKE